MSTARVDRFTSRQVDKALDQLARKDLEALGKELDKGANAALKQALVEDAREHGGARALKDPDKLKGLITAQLLAIQRAVQGSARHRDHTIDLAAVSKSFGGLAASLFARVDRARQEVQGRSKVDALDQQKRAAARDEALGSFISYFPAASKLPALAEGKTLLTFDTAQIRWLHRTYWSASPAWDFQRLCAEAEKAPEFKSRKEPIADHQLQRLFTSLPESFPWQWGVRTSVIGSYHLVDQALKAPAGTSFARMYAALKESHKGFPYDDIVKRWTRKEWYDSPERYPFLTALPRDAEGHFVLEAQGEAQAVQRDGKGRLLLSEALAKKVAELGRRDEVLYGWGLADFLKFVSKELGIPFNRNNYDALLERQRLSVPAWTTMKRDAMVRLAKKIVELHATRRLDSSEAIATVLHQEFGYKKFPRVLFDYLRDTVKDPKIPYFHQSKSKSAEEQARALVDAIKAEGGETYAEAGARLGLDEVRTKYLAEIARKKWPAEFKQHESKRAPYTPAEIALLRAALDASPIGASAADIYRTLKKTQPELVARHPLGDPRNLGVVYSTHLAVSDWPATQRRRLAVLLHETGRKLGEVTDGELIRAARAVHAIDYTDLHIKSLLQQWRKDPHAAATAGLIDERGGAGWDKDAGRRYAATIRAFRALYPASQKPPKVAHGATVQSFNAEQVRAIFDAYWSAPPLCEVEDLAASLKTHAAFAGRDVEVGQLNGLFNRERQAFPWGMRSKSFALRSFVFVCALEKIPQNTPVADLLRKFEQDHPGFGTAAFVSAAKRAWKDEPDRFPFLKDKLEIKKGGYVIRALGKESGIAVAGERMRLTEEVAREIARLSRDPRIRYDWDAEAFRRFISQELGTEFTSANHIGLRRKFDFVPEYTEIRRLARENFCKLVRELYDGPPPVHDPTELVRILHQEHGYPLYDPNRFGTLRQEFPQLIPNFRVAMAGDTVEEARAFLTEIKKHQDRGIYELGALRGWDWRQTDHRTKLIRTLWPGELADVPHGAAYSDADKKVLRELLDDSRIGAPLYEVLEALRTEHPEMLDRHPFASTSPVHAAIQKHLGVSSYAAFQDERLEQLVAKVSKASPRGIGVVELHRALRQRYDLAYGIQAFRNRLSAWAQNPGAHPHAAKLLDSQGRMPWDVARTALTEALAVEVGQVIRDHPKELLRGVVHLLKRDPRFAAAQPNFDVDTIIQLRARFPEKVPYIEDVRDDSRGHGHSHFATLAKRLQKLVGADSKLQDAAPATLARRLEVDQEDVVEALRRFPHLFPWRRGRAGGNIDERLALRIAYAIEMAPVDKTRAEIIAELRHNKAFSERYPDFDGYTWDAARSAYPEIVPDWAWRQQILAARRILDKIWVAPKGTPFADTLATLRKLNPDIFAGPAFSEGALTSLWRAESARFPFLAKLLDAKGRFDLTGRGEKETPRDGFSGAILARLAHLESIPEELPLLNEIAAVTPKTAFRDVEVVAVQHLLDTQVATFETYRRLGLTPERASIVGVPYSACEPAVQTLADKGWDVRVPPLDMSRWVEDVRGALYDRLANAKIGNRKVVVLDDGGICSHLIATDPYLRDNAHSFRIVEQTRRGITVAEGLDLPTSLVNVAQSWGKFVEGPLIADEVSEVLLRRLHHLGIKPKDLVGKKVTLVGAGTIGLPTAEALAALGCNVTLLDKKPDAVRATGTRLEIVDANDSEARRALLASQDIVLGATGVRSIEVADFACFKKGCIVCSASSKLVEIDVAGLEALCRDGGSIEVIDSYNHPPTLRYTFKDGRTIDLLASGFPLNFDGGPENSPPQLIQLTRALMLIGALQASGNKITGIGSLDVRRQLHLLAHFRALAHDDIESDDARKQAITVAQAQLESLRLRERESSSRRVPRAKPPRR
ncbi:MAG: hypothetical protein HY903_22595 [Deltaproteobacteria bacterium]|nr:hypothetical protein [Deltaproteobacteria bacterium]